MMGRHPRVSIGLPVFNGERYLEEAIQSLLSQTFSDLELVICDNASTDRTAEICDKYAALDERIRYHRNPRNLGASRNFNLTFECSTGEYFRWAAYDDLCAPQLVERCVAVLDADPSVVLCYPKTVTIDEKGVVVGPHEDNLVLLDHDAAERHKAILRRFRTNARCEPVFGLMRREALAGAGLLGNYNSADVILLQKLSLLGRFQEVPEHLFFRRFHPLISTRANPTPEAIAAWFDPNNRARVVAPKWRLFTERFKGIHATPLNVLTRMRCYSQVAQEMLWWSPGLGMELVRMTKVSFLRFSRSSHSRFRS